MTFCNARRAICAGAFLQLEGLVQSENIFLPFLTKLFFRTKNAKILHQASFPMNRKISISLPIL